VNPAAGKISHESPLGEAIVGKKKGEKVEVDTPNGKEKYEIKNIK
jgi:transcription elongation factor GreA